MPSGVLFVSDKLRLTKPRTRMQDILLGLVAAKDLFYSEPCNKSHSGVVRIYYRKRRNIHE